LAKRKSSISKKPRRTYTGKKKNKGRKLFFGVLGFIFFFSITIFALTYINKGIKRDYSTIRITQDELLQNIKIINSKLNKLISKSGFLTNEIINKKTVVKTGSDLEWEYKEVTLQTTKISKIEIFKDGVIKQIKDESIDIYIDEKGNITLVKIDVFNFETHKINFIYQPEDKEPGKFKTDIIKKDKVSNKKKSSVEIPSKDKDIVLSKPTKDKPKIVLIVDDIGSNKNYIDDLLEIPTYLNFAILPELPYSKYAAEQAAVKGWDVMLHLPMEPKFSSGYSGLDAGRNALLTGIPKKDLKVLLEKNLNSVPNIKGVNNHMGSKFTENTELMELVLNRLKEEGLFFIDSKTSSNSVGYSKARIMGVKTAQRDIFLDEDKASEELIRKRIRELINISKRHGSAVGICHPYPNTIKVLSEMLPELQSQVDFISASNIVK